jgi:hypothetical protein
MAPCSWPLHLQAFSPCSGLSSPSAWICNFCIGLRFWAHSGPPRPIAKPIMLFRFRGQSNACKPRLHWSFGSGDASATNPGRRHRWLIPHPSGSRSTTDCRPLLQQSSPNRGRVVSSDTECSSEPSTLHLHRHRCPLENQQLTPGTFGPRRQRQQLHPTTAVF